MSFEWINSVATVATALGTLALAMLTACVIMIKKFRDDRRERRADREMFLKRIDAVFEKTENKRREDFRTLLKIIREEGQTLRNGLKDLAKQVADLRTRMSEQFHRADEKRREDFLALLRIVQEQGAAIEKRFNGLTDQTRHFERMTGKRSDRMNEAVEKLREEQHRVATQVAKLSGIVHRATGTTLPEYVAAQAIPDEDRSE